MEIATIYSSPHQNGFLLFALGILSILSVYHFLLFFQQQDKSYLYYATYTFLLLVAYIAYPKNSFLTLIPSKVISFLELTHQFWVWTYNIVYFYFALYFLNFKKYYPKQNKILLTALFALLGIGMLLFAYTLFCKNNNLLNWIYNAFYTKAIIIITLWGFYLVANVKEATKYYILSGSIFLFAGSLLAILIIDFGVITQKLNIGFFLFYIGMLLENLCFSLALGLKQKLVAEEKNKAQSNLIDKLQENKKLKTIVTNELRDKIKVLDEQLKLQREIEDLKLTTFKNQMKPHFIFNALNSIKLYINKNDKTNANLYLSNFAKLIRKVLEVSSSNYISLEEELEIIKLYIDIENTRFLEPIATTISVDESLALKKVKIPSLILQPFVENAIWHGLSSKESNKKIDIKINATLKGIQIVINDNGIGRKQSAKIQANRFVKKKSIGIQLIKNKLANISNSKNNLNIIDLFDLHQNPTGTSVVIELINS